MTEHTYLVPMFITRDKFKAMDIAADDFTYSGEHAEDYKQALNLIRDRRVMELPEDERVGMGLANRYWKVTIETHT